MKATRTMAIATGVALLATGLFAAPSVEITSVQQQYPWTNTVDIVYTVAGVDSETNGYFVVFTPTTSDGKEILDVNGEKSVQVALKGSGVYSTQWFPQTNQQYTACKMTPSVFRGAAKDYMIIDLENWTVAYEPMATQADSNKRYNTDEYKTKKMVLRRVPAGTYTIGHANWAKPYAVLATNSVHSVNIPTDYYLGIFEVTVAQYNRMLLSDSPGTSTLPQGYLVFNTLRGNALNGAQVSTGPLYNLAARTRGTTGNASLYFDVPTESMWEIAARAGTDGVYIMDVPTRSAMSQYAWTDDFGHLEAVGQKLPNGWGFYDLVGNAAEFCRDAANRTDLAKLQPNGLVPIATAGPGLNNQCVMRGAYAGSSENDGRYFELSYREYFRPKNNNWVGRGFRVACINPLNN